MIACGKGLLMCAITDMNTFEIVRAEEEYRELYVVNLCWCGGDRYVVATSRPRYPSKKKIPAGEENYVIISYSLYTTNEAD